MADKYNAHIHVFTGRCAPKDFLQVGASMGDGGAKLLKSIFMSKPGSWLVRKLAGPKSNRTLQFLKVGVMASQREVFFNNVKNYDKVSKFSGMKFIGLTIDMDYMTNDKNKPTQDFNSQIQEVIEIKKTMPDRFFPFYGIDPRNPQTLNLEILKAHIESKIFSGIKIYPAKGFFPFDERMDAVYKYAEENRIPVMTHCTRSGSFYVGDNIWSIIPDNPPSLNPAHPVMDEVRARITAYKTSGDKSMQENKRVCNLFTHPNNYIPILDKYPKLKLCMAHLGGIPEILGSSNNNSKDVGLLNTMLKLENGSLTWYELVRDRILKNYTDTYADISYSLCDPLAMEKVNGDLDAGLLPSGRILFGTDYFMVEQEDDEIEVVAIAEEKLAGYLEGMMTVNAQEYLFK